MVDKNIQKLAKRIVETTAYDPDTETLFVSNPGISFEVLKGLAKKHNFTIGQTKSGQYISIPTAFKHTSELTELYDDFLNTYTLFSKNYETLQTAYKTFDAMDENISEVGLILDTYAAEVLSEGFIDDPLNIKINNKAAQDLVERVFYKNKIFQRLPNIVRSIAKYGNYGFLLSYPYLEKWMTEEDVDEFKRIDVLEDLIISFVNPKRFKVNTDEYYNVINYEVEDDVSFTKTGTTATSTVTKKIWQPWSFCFTKDTKIALLDGRNLTLGEIEKEFGTGEFWVYSCNENGRILPGKAHSLRKTREKAELIEVELDNGEKIHCTPDHKFMLKSGLYCEAKDLIPGTSLMPLYRQIKDSSHNRRGYEQFFDNHAKKWLFTHWRVAEEIYGTKRDKNGRFSKSYHVHHKDFNSLNNSPENLQWLTCEEHNRVHAELMKDPIRSAHVRKASSETLKHTWETQYDYMREQCKINANKTVQKRLDETGSKVTETQRQASRNNIQKAIEGNKGRKHNYTEEQLKRRSEIGRKGGLKNKGRKHSPEITEKARQNLKNAYTKFFENLTEEEKRIHLSNKAKKGWETRRKKQQEDAKKYYNHKVVAIRPYNTEDVYDFTVDNYHNFALSAGVFVHNCHAKLADELTEPYGKSMLWSMRSAFDQLTTLESLLGISRASNIQRLVFYVPLPNGINIIDGYSHMNEWRAQYLNSVFSDTNSPKAGRKLPGAMSILTLPEAADGKKVTIDTIEGKIDLAATEDVGYFLDKILRNSSLPKGYLVGEDVITTAQALEAQDLKLKRTLLPLKKAFLECMMNLTENVLTHAGYDVSKLDITVSLNEPIQIPADVIDKYSTICDLMKSFIELNKEMPTINKFQFLVKMGLPTEIASLVCSNSSINVLSSAEELGKFLNGQRVRDPNMLMAPEIEESISLNNKQFNKENHDTCKVLKELYDFKNENKNRMLKENFTESKKVFGSNKEYLSEDVKQ